PEQVVKVRTVNSRWADDGHLAGQLVGAAQSVDLTPVWTAEQIKQQRHQGLALLWNVLGAQKDAFAGTAAHQGEIKAATVSQWLLLRCRQVGMRIGKWALSRPAG